VSGCVRLSNKGSLRLVLYYQIQDLFQTYAYLPLINVQPVPEKMRLEMVIGIQKRNPRWSSQGSFANGLFEKRTQLSPSKILFLYSDDHFESHLPGNGL